MQGINTEIQQYTALGFDTLPLEPGTKKAWSKGWPRLSPEQMWQGAPDNANVGIRAGGPAQLAVIDCDDKEIPGTFQNIQNWLTGLGYEPGTYPLVQTASRIGYHAYFQFRDRLPKSYKVISTDFGAGEFRCGSGAYVVAPPSVVAENPYSLVSGDFARLPLLGLQDVETLLGIKVTLAGHQKTKNVKQTGYIPRNTLALLNGQGLERYETCSHAEQAILVGLVNAGFSFDDALGILTKYPGAAKFQEEFIVSPVNAVRRLRLSFDNAFDYATNNESKPRQYAEQARKWGLTHVWRGGTGTYDKKVYIAHTSIAYNACKYVYGASARDLSLAMKASMSPEACMNATKRLIEAGLLLLVKEAVGGYSHLYKLIVPNSDTPTQEERGSVKVWD
ncbi:MAG: bifunctional DNA primase/polymerase [Anaerolineales bacterium]|nr:bifunctional DNA primase/polymerase [Anaerolineales bacterium]